LAAEAVDQEQRRTRALVDVMDATAVEFEKAPARRVGDLDLSGGIGGEPDQAANDNRQ
jgi:hypothetical protein